MANLQEMRRPTPEGLTPAQAKFASMIFDVMHPGHFRIRMGKRGNYHFEEVDRMAKTLEFAKADGEFAVKHHEKHPGAKLSPFYLNLRNLRS